MREPEFDKTDVVVITAGTTVVTIGIIAIILNDLGIITLGG